MIVQIMSVRSNGQPLVGHETILAEGFLGEIKVVVRFPCCLSLSGSKWEGSFKMDL